MVSSQVNSVLVQTEVKKDAGICFENLRYRGGGKTGNKDQGLFLETDVGIRLLIVIPNYYI